MTKRVQKLTEIGFIRHRHIMPVPVFGFFGTRILCKCRFLGFSAPAYHASASFRCFFGTRILCKCRIWRVSARNASCGLAFLPPNSIKPASRSLVVGSSLHLLGHFSHISQTMRPSQPWVLSRACHQNNHHASTAAEGRETREDGSRNDSEMLLMAVSKRHWSSLNRAYKKSR